MTRGHLGHYSKASVLVESAQKRHHVTYVVDHVVRGDDVGQSGARGNLGPEALNGLSH